MTYPRKKLSSGGLPGEVFRVAFYVIRFLAEFYYPQPQTAQTRSIDTHVTIQSKTDPAQPSLVRGGGICDVISIQAEAHFQTQGITSA